MTNLKMNCGYCGRKCSLDKDFCIPQDSVYICKSCYDWKQKVDDLEAKLADRKQFCESQVKSLTDIIAGLIETKHDLEAKLEESERLLKKQCYKNIQELEDVFNYNLNQVAILSQQLAEKDAELNRYAELFGMKDKDFYVVEKNEYDKMVSGAKQFANQTAIAELEKVKNIIDSKVKNIDKRLDDLNIKIVCESTSMQLSTYKEIIKLIDQQIKLLKGE